MKGKSFTWKYRGERKEKERGGGCLDIAMVGDRRSKT